MKNKVIQKIFLVDDDALFLKILEMELTQLGKYNIQTFSTGEACITNLKDIPDVIILDYHLDGITANVMNGIETLDTIKAYNIEIPVIMLSSQDKIEVAVNCMHHHAYDYIVKSETAPIRLQKNLNDILKYNKMKKELNWYMANI